MLKLSRQLCEDYAFDRGSKVAKFISIYKKNTVKFNAQDSNFNAQDSKFYLV